MCKAGGTPGPGAGTMEVQEMWFVGAEGLQLIQVGGLRRLPRGGGT